MCGTLWLLATVTSSCLRVNSSLERSPLLFVSIYLFFIFFKTLMSLTLPKEFHKLTVKGVKSTLKKISTWFYIELFHFCISKNPINFNCLFKNIKKKEREIHTLWNRFTSEKFISCHPLEKPTSATRLARNPKFSADHLRFVSIFFFLTSRSISARRPKAKRSINLKENPPHHPSWRVCVYVLLSSLAVVSCARVCVSVIRRVLL